MAFFEGAIWGSIQIVFNALDSRTYVDCIGGRVRWFDRCRLFSFSNGDDTACVVRMLLWMNLNSKIDKAAERSECLRKKRWRVDSWLLLVFEQEK